MIAGCLHFCSAEIHRQTPQDGGHHTRHSKRRAESRWSFLYILTLLLLSIHAFTAAAINIDLLGEDIGGEKTLDLSFKVGGVFGNAVKPPDSAGGTEQTAGYGGYYFAVSYHRGLFAKLSAYFQGGLAIDAGSFQVNRQGGEIGVAYHLFGGSKLIKWERRLANVYHRNSYDLSLLSQIGLHHYAASSETDTSQNFVGRSMEVMVGVGYRQDLSKSISVGIDYLTTALSVPASVERIEASNNLFTLNWRQLI